MLPYNLAFDNLSLLEIIVTSPPTPEDHPLHNRKTHLTFQCRFLVCKAEVVTSVIAGDPSCDFCSGHLSSDSLDVSVETIKNWESHEEVSVPWIHSKEVMNKNDVTRDPWKKG